jgi:DNA mismatch endonuclease (patch repair protein)
MKKYRTVIFVHGCFWHRHENCKYAYTPKSRIDFWNRKFEENMANDLKVERQLMEDGWKVIIIWECQINEPEIMEKAIEDLVRSRNNYEPARKS